MSAAESSTASPGGNVDLAAELRSDAGARGYLQDQIVIGVGEKLARSTHAKQRTVGRDNAEPGQQLQCQVGVEWAVRLRLHLEPQHLAAVELAERRDPFALGKRLGREPELRRLVHRLAPGPQVCSRRRTSEKLYIPEYFVFDQAALRFRPRNL